jgi:hypothetical protein
MLQHRSTQRWHQVRRFVTQTLHHAESPAKEARLPGRLLQPSGALADGQGLRGVQTLRQVHRAGTEGRTDRKVKEIVEYGFLLVFANICLYAIVFILKDYWQSREARIAMLEQKVDDIKNGQWSSLVQRLDASTDAEAKMAAALEAIAKAMSRAPCGPLLEEPPDDGGADG